MRISLLFLFLTSISVLSAQEDFSWWNDRNNWDGVTDWREYLIFAPAFFGPNALPVPRLKNGLLEDQYALDFTLGGHFNTGDRTLDNNDRLYLPLAPGKVALELQMVPLELYAFDTLIRDQRRARDFDGKGWASGDVYVSTYVQVLKDHKKLPDLLLSINLKTASGNRITAARFTDTPGYSFDLSAGKSFPLGGKLFREIRPHAALGFYVWQTAVVQQNDAFLYGAGLDLSTKTWTISTALTGYVGYLGEGDDPLVFRLNFATQKDKKMNWLLNFQAGLNDFPFTSVHAGLRVDLEKIRAKADR